MVVFILIMLYVNYEYSVDQYHQNKDKIYRIVKQEEGNMYLGKNRFAVTMAPLGPAVLEEFPEVKSAARIVRTWNVIIKGHEETILEPIVYGIDPESFDIFSFSFLHGNPDTYLRKKYSVVISEKIARKYFEDENPIGQVLLYNEEVELEIGGVIKDMPLNSHFRMDIMLPFETLLGLTNRKEDLFKWNNSSYYTYILLQDNSDPASLEEKFPALMSKYSADEHIIAGHTTRLYLEKFSRIHLHSDIHFDIGPTVNIDRLYIYSTIAILILLIACINYMNLASARAATRAREVGIRKVAGAYRHNLVFQFLGESLFLSFFSLLASLLLVSIILPYFKQFVELDLTLNFLHEPRLLVVLLSVCLIVGLVAGSYPAFALSGYKPILVLKGYFSRSPGGSRLRKALVIIQFTISSCLIISALIITQQLSYIQKKDMGYERNHILTFRLKDNDILDKIPVLKEELQNLPEVLNVSVSSNLPNNISSSTYVMWPGKPEDIRWMIYTGEVDQDFVELFEIDIIKGRNFSIETGDKNGMVLINETAARALPWEDPLGRELANWRDTCTIVGIMKDFHQHSLHQEIMPLQLFLNEQRSTVSVKVSGYDLKHTISEIGRIKESFSDKYPFTYSFFDDEFDKAYKIERKTEKMAEFFTLITIIIACLGLYGLATFTAEQRVKEVGIRKVMGAPVYQLVYMLSKDFTIPVFFSFLISVPIANYLMKNWLDGFAYHINIELFHFLATLIIMILIAWITISFRTFRVASINPVDSLRHE
jgi:putative ABC transport system permease protein